MKFWSSGEIFESKKISIITNSDRTFCRKENKSQNPLISVYISKYMLNNILKSTYILK